MGISENSPDRHSLRELGSLDRVENWVTLGSGTDLLVYIEGEKKKKKDLLPGKQSKSQMLTNVLMLGDT